MKTKMFLFPFIFNETQVYNKVTVSICVFFVGAPPSVSDLLRSCVELCLVWIGYFLPIAK